MFNWFEMLFLPTEFPDITQSLIALLMAIGSGVFLGRLKLGNVSLGVSGVMFSSLLLGHLGYRIEEHILYFVRDFGLILFVYGIGIQVGPSFFSSLRKEGLKLNALALCTVAMGGGITYLLYTMTGVSMENMVGLMSGAVTNTPGLGAAKSTLQEIQQQFPERSFDNPAIAYAITYPLGVFGIIAMIIISKVILKIEPEEEMRKFRMEKIQREEPLIHKKCRVTNPDCFNRSIEQVVREFGWDRVLVSRLKHSGSEAIFSPSPQMLLRERDVLMIVGQEADVDAFIQRIGRPSSDPFIESEGGLIIRTLFVTKPKATHKKLAELDLFNRLDLRVTRVYRAGREMLARPSLELFYGDKLRVVGSAEAIAEAEKLIGNSEKRLMEPDFTSLFGGLLIGIILGSIPIFLPTLPAPVRLGLAAGPLITALVVSRFGGIGVIHSYLNNGAIYFMKDLGICLFFAAVGLQAGQSFYENFLLYQGWLLIGYGFFITFIPLIFMVLVARWVMKLNFLQLSGLMSGTYTDPAALSFSTSYLDSDVPIQSYATVYPLVTIFRIFIAQLLILVAL